MNDLGLATMNDFDRFGALRGSLVARYLTLE